MHDTRIERKSVRLPSMADALIPVGFLVVSLIGAIAIYGDGAILGPVQVAMFMSAAVAGIIGFKNGHTEASIAKAAVDSVGSAMGAIFILFAVGALIGTWNMSGTIATLADYGIKILNPSLFYATAAIICAVIAMGIGSSWTVMATMGVALIAIAESLGLSPAVAAGAVISGAYFGDKMSPLSETTNLAPAVAGTDLYKHIRAMVATTVPSITIALILYLIIGFGSNTSGAIDEEAAISGIEGAFRVGIVPLIPLAVVVVLAVRKIHPTLAILAGALTGGLVAVFWQPDVVAGFVGATGPVAMLEGVWTAMGTGFTADTGSIRLDDLLSGGGMAKMLTTIWLIMAALAFGGIMNYCGLLGKLIEPMRRRANTDRRAMLSVGGTAIGINVIAADQYLSIVLTGNVFKEDFKKRGIAPQSLSRMVEDTGTVTSVLIPWNSCGAYASGVLGVSALAYFPFAFFNWINPLLSLFYSAMGWQIQKVAPDEAAYAETPEDVEFYGVAEPHGRDTPQSGA